MSAWSDLRAEEKRGVVLSIAGLVLLTCDILTGSLLTHADEWIRDVVQPRPQATPFWMAGPSGLGGVGVAVGLMAIAGLTVAQYSWRLWPVILAAANFVVAELLVLALKVAVGRPGPGIWATRTDYPGYFPSGHTATSAVCAGTVVFLLMMARGDLHRVDRAAATARLVGIVLGAAAGLDAVLADYHWVTDCLGGLLVAMLVLTTSFAACRAFLDAPKSVGHET